MDLGADVGTGASLDPTPVVAGLKYFLLMLEATAAEPSNPIAATIRLTVAPYPEKYLKEIVITVSTKKNDPLPSKCLFCQIILR